MSRNAIMVYYPCRILIQAQGCNARWYHILLVPLLIHRQCRIHSCLVTRV